MQVEQSPRRFYPAVQRPPTHARQRPSFSAVLVRVCVCEWLIAEALMSAAPEPPCYLPNSIIGNYYYHIQELVHLYLVCLHAVCLQVN